MNPPYMSRETLADALDIMPGLVDQLVKRGLLPEPIMIGEAKRWRWDDVDKLISQRASATAVSQGEADDPYLRGGHGPAVARIQRNEQGR